MSVVAILFLLWCIGVGLLISSYIVACITEAVDVWKGLVYVIFASALLTACFQPWRFFAQ